MSEAALFWEDRYSGSERVWSGSANPSLVAAVSGFVPGRALDLGCGEGGDAVWLARHGWQVRGVDISPTAVARGNLAAADLGLGTRVELVAADLADWHDPGPYGLVTACFLQSPLTLDRHAMLTRAASGLVPGGHLLVVTHAAPPPWAAGLAHGHHVFLTPEQELAALDLPQPDWEVVVAEVRRRRGSGPDGAEAELEDVVVLLRRVR